MEQAFKINIGLITIISFLLCISLYLLSKVIPLTELILDTSKIFEKPWTLITSIFLHLNLAHLFYNMISLFLLGNLLELRLKRKYFTIIFFLSGIIPNIIFSIINPNSLSLGISGIIYGLIGAAVILAPNARILLPLGRFSVPAPVKIAGPLIAIGEIFLINIPDGIGHLAHASGFIVGLIISIIIKIRGFPSYSAHHRMTP